MTSGAPLQGVPHSLSVRATKVLRGQNPSAARDTGAMHVEVVGEGTPIVLLHGAGVSGWMWRPTLELLGTTVQTVVMDLPGFGRSTDQPYVSHQLTLAELSNMIRQQAPQGAHVVGFSLGAQLAILLAAQHPGLVRSVVVVSGQTRPTSLPRLTTCLVGMSAPLARQRWFAKAQATQLGIPADLVDDYLQDSAATTSETLIASVDENIRFTVPDGWSDYSGSASVLVGANERKLMHDSARATAEALPGCSVQTVDGAAHDIPFSRPDALVATLRGHIDVSGR